MPSWHVAVTSSHGMTRRERRRGLVEGRQARGKGGSLSLDGSTHDGKQREAAACLDIKCAFNIMAEKACEKALLAALCLWEGMADEKASLGQAY